MTPEEVEIQRRVNLWTEFKKHPMYLELCLFLKEEQAHPLARVLGASISSEQRTYYAGYVAALDIISAKLQANVSLDPASFEPSTQGAQSEPGTEDFISPEDVPV